MLLDKINRVKWRHENSPFQGGQQRVAKAKRRRGMLVRFIQRVSRSRTNIPHPRWRSGTPFKGGIFLSFVYI